MTYDEFLADRVREIVQDEPGLRERRMFGGLAFLVNGHLAAATSGQGGLMVHVEDADSEALVDGEGVHRVVMRGREMRSWLRVDSDVLRTDEALRRWVERGLVRARSTPPG